jgi:hypothetical protein
MPIKAISVAAAASIMLLTASVAVRAQDAQTAPDMPPAVDIYTDIDAKAVLDARLIALKTVIGLTAEQAGQWAGFETALRTAAAEALARGKQRAEAAPPADFVDVLDRIADAEITRGQSLKAVAAAARPLVASLSEEQKRRIPAFLGMVDNANGPQPTADLWIFEDEN